MNLINMNQPLVSVTVITYNSSKTVLETLESIKAQTYQNIELIVSDDCSTDNTVDLCRNWIEQNKSRFVRTELLTVDKNTGISANGNRAGAACKGEWVKPIAGDDILLPNCVQDCMDYVVEHQDATVFFGQTSVLGNNLALCKTKEKAMRQYNATMARLDSANQLAIVLNGDCPQAPSLFYKKCLFDEGIMKNDERISLIEDWPKWIKLLSHGMRLDFLNKVVVRYRLGGISNSEQWQSVRMFQNKRMVYFFYVWDVLSTQDIDDLKLKTIEYECEKYNCYMQKCDELRKVQNSHAYRLGKAILWSFKKLKILFERGGEVNV